MAEQSDTQASFETVAIVGVGLIGGSLAAALKSGSGGGPSIIGVGRNQRRLEAARDAQLIDRLSTELPQAAAEADLLVFCTPVDLIAEGIREAGPHCRPGTLITDAGSVKSAICDSDSESLAEGVAFIGSHPLAGSEQRGFEHADSRLFEGRVCVVTPEASTPEPQVQRLTSFWQALGMRVVRMTPAGHDAAVAQTSHVPHLVACALAAGLEERNQPLAATGFGDTTRIAAGDPDIWLPIVLQNGEEILRSLDSFDRRVDEFREAIRAQDQTRLRTLLETAKSRREELDSRET